MYYRDITIIIQREAERNEKRYKAHNVVLLLDGFVLNHNFSFRLVIDSLAS